MKQSRRKFIATAVSGAVASVSAPLALAEENAISRTGSTPTACYRANTELRMFYLKKYRNL